MIVDALDDVGPCASSITIPGAGGDLWFVSWGSAVEFKLRLRLSYRQWSKAVERGQLVEVRAWLAEAETALTKAIRATEPSLFAQAQRFTAIGSAWKEVTC